MRGRKNLLWLLVSTAIGCGSTEIPENTGAIVPFQVAKTGATPFGDIPWPSDLYLGADGRVGEVPNLARVSATSGAIQAGLSSLDGFARASGGLFFLPDLVDPSSVPDDYEKANNEAASIFIVDVDSNSPARGQRYPVLAKYLPSLQCLSVIPVKFGSKNLATNTMNEG